MHLYLEQFLLKDNCQPSITLLHNEPARKRDCRAEGPPGTGASGECRSLCVPCQWTGGPSSIEVLWLTCRVTVTRPQPSLLGTITAHERPLHRETDTAGGVGTCFAHPLGLWACRAPLPEERAELVRCGSTACRATPSRESVATVGQAVCSCGRALSTPTLTTTRLPKPTSTQSTQNPNFQDWERRDFI